MPFLLLLGGARSGKSALAVRIAAGSGAAVTFIATGEAGDQEMAERIARHRAERPSAWATVEAPVAVLDAVAAAPAGDLLVVDCLTLWVSNLLLGGDRGGGIVAAAGDLAGALAERAGGAVVVSNEVGLGIVPANRLARDFRDTLGSVNAAFAARAERTALVVAGRVHELTASSDFLEGIAWLPDSNRR
ncbi:MAG TPA: bifunctional adenosylcobinamide kinase/adenosylcobinamide-phosphate guanylyltransferase [Candidatus Dormibacteraeota bacterium]|jgi:adenosyl cobinamide kinase/adenosyl cobinamide phosphate guanylyltransferase